MDCFATRASTALRSAGQRTPTSFSAMRLILFCALRRDEACPENPLFQIIQT